MKARIDDYLSTKNIRRRKRTDSARIMVAVIGIAGSVLVFNSYASRKIETQNPGDYSIISLLAQNGSKYQNISKVKTPGMQDVYYLNKSSNISTPFTLPASRLCIYGWNRKDATLSATATNIPTKLSLLENNLATDYPLKNGPSRALVCYDSSQYFNIAGELLLKSGGSVWLDKVVTE